MNKDLHDLDDIFNSAHEQYEDDPSSGVWDKIKADLDRKDAEKYKRRFIGWKRVAVILILLLSGFVLYESGIIVKRPGGNNNETLTSGLPGKDSIQKNNTAGIPKEQNRNVINNQPGIPAIEETLNEKNNNENEPSLPNISSIKEEK